MQLQSQNKLKLVTNNVNSANPVELQSQKSEEEEVLIQMLNAYTNRLMSRRLKPRYIDSIISVIQSFVSYTNLYPWEWSSEDFEDWSTYLYQVRKNGESTQRHKQNRINKFQNFLFESKHFCDLCNSKFGKKPIKICSDENLIPHKVEDENEEKRTAFTREQLACLWNFFDNEIMQAYKNKSKKLKTLQRDKVLYLIIYYYGLRVNEVSKADTTDFISNPRKPEWGNFGGIIVKHGKSTAGSPPKRRTVWTISENAVKYIKWYLENVRPLFGFDEINSLFLSERGTMLTPNSITRNFKEYLKSAGLPYEHFSPHCLRHSYISHLSEKDDVSPRFIQDQVGHVFLATTQLYTHLSDAFVNRQLDKVINRQIDKYIKR